MFTLALTVILTLFARARLLRVGFGLAALLVFVVLPAFRMSLALGVFTILVSLAVRHFAKRVLLAKRMPLAIYAAFALRFAFGVSFAVMVAVVVTILVIPVVVTVIVFAIFVAFANLAFAVRMLVTEWVSFAVRAAFASFLALHVHLDMAPITAAAVSNLTGNGGAIRQCKFKRVAFP